MLFIVGKIVDHKDIYGLQILGLDTYEFEVIGRPPYSWYGVELTFDQMIKLRYQLNKEIGEIEMKEKPFDKREDKDTKKAFKRTNKSVKPVAKDKNSTRRKMSTPMKRGK